MKRLGLIIPSSNTTMESEFNRILPKGYTTHSARVLLREVTIKGLAEMDDRVEEEALKLATAQVNLIGYGCTTGSLFKGLGYDKILENRIEKISGVPSVVTAGAVVVALKKLNVINVAVATPYINKLNFLEEKFLLGNGFNVVDIKGLGITDNIKIGNLDSKILKKLVMSLNSKDADGVFISCTNFPTIDIINSLEKYLNKPVISSNTATLWAMLRKIKSAIKIDGFGKLYERMGHFEENWSV